MYWFRNYGAISTNGAPSTVIPQSYQSADIETELISSSQDNHPLRFLLQKNFLALFFVNDDEILKVSGMDGYVLLRFLHMCAKILSITSLFALIILLPVYFTGLGNDNVFGINLYSMANLEVGSPRLWASWVFTYVFTFIFLYFIHREYENFAAKRRDFFKFGDEMFIATQTTHTVQVLHRHRAKPHWRYSLTALLYTRWKISQSSCRTRRV